MLGIHGIPEACRAVFNDCFTTARTLARVTGATCVSHEHLLVPLGYSIAYNHCEYEVHGGQTL